MRCPPTRYPRAWHSSPGADLSNCRKLLQRRRDVRPRLPAHHVAIPRSSPPLQRRLRPSAPATRCRNRPKASKKRAAMSAALHLPLRPVGGLNARSKGVHLQTHCRSLFASISLVFHAGGREGEYPQGSNPSDTNWIFTTSWNSPNFAETHIHRSTRRAKSSETRKLQ